MSQYESESKGADELLGKFSGYPDELEDPDWEVVERTYQLADDDGRSAHYADVRQNNKQVAAFFVEEQKELVKRTGGAVQYQAEQDGCKGEYYGAVSRGLERGVEERLEKRAEASSQALQYIEQHEAIVGKKNAETLRNQAGDISLAAHVVYVALAERHQELERLVEEADTVKKTIERRLEELEKPVQGEASQEALADREAELEALSRAQGELDAAVSKARKKLEKSEQNVEKARKRYQKQFDALMKEAKSKAKSQAQ